MLQPRRWSTPQLTSRPVPPPPTGAPPQPAPAPPPHEPPRARKLRLTHAWSEPNLNLAAAAAATSAAPDVAPLSAPPPSPPPSQSPPTEPHSLRSYNPPTDVGKGSGVCPR
eukprot:1451760-Prymnesium_polylepis.1